MFRPVKPTDRSPKRRKAGAMVQILAAAILVNLPWVPTAGAEQQSELILQADDPLEVTVGNERLKVRVETGGIDRPVIDPEIVARLGIKPAEILGKATLRIGRTRVLTGRNRPMTFSVAGATQKARIFWFEGAGDDPADGTIGPWGLPQDHVEIRLGGSGTALYQFPLFGSASNQSWTSFKHDGGVVGLTFAVEDQGPYPIASAAAGAAIAKAYDGVATEQIWDETIILGIRRPVRLVKLGRPLVVGPFSINEIAVRVRDGRDGLGSGDGIAMPVDPSDDPSEIVVTANNKKGPAPVFTFTIGRARLQQCRSVSYIKSAKEIRLAC